MEKGKESAPAPNGGKVIAVTGASGAVGSAVVKLAVEAGYDVIAVAREQTPMLPEAKGPYRTRFGDLTNRRFCRKAVEGADIVIHTAALNDPTRTYEELVPINVEVVRWLYEAAEDNDASRFVHFSTASLYNPRRGVLGEDAEFETRSNYSLTKEEAERFLRSRSSGDLPWTILRPSMTYGPGGRTLGAGVLLLPPLLRLFFPYVPALTGGPRNNWLHTSDAARAALFVATCEEAANNIYNVADDTPLSQGEILSAAIQAYGLKIGPTLPYPQGLMPSISRFINLDIVFKVLTNVLTPLWKRIEQRHDLKGELNLNVDRSVLTYLGGDRVVGTDKLKALGWQPEYPDLRDGMAETIRWYQEKEWVPDYNALPEEDIDYSDMGISLLYKEHYEGFLELTETGGQADTRLDATITFPNIKQLLVDRAAMIEGTLSIEGDGLNTKDAPISGTLKVHLASATMAYQFTFEEDGGEALRFVGAKKIGVVSAITDFAHLDGTIITTNGEVLAKGEIAIDLKEGLVKTLLSLRLT